MAGTSVRDTSQVELVIGGMTCASCANRVEKRLNRLDGVTASVNYATEKASVRFDERVSPDDLIAQVEKAGYTAALPVAEDRADEVGPLRLRLVISTLLALPVVALAMIAPLRFAYWQWVSLVLAAPVVLWGGLPFHRATWKNLKLRIATMDTLVSMGTGAAFVWSVYALVFGTAGEAGMRDAFSLTAGGGAGDIYLEVAAGVTTFILAGRYFEARAKRRAGAALRALLKLGAKDVAVLRRVPAGLVEERIPTEQLAAGERFVVRPGEKIAPDGAGEEATSASGSTRVPGAAGSVTLPNGLGSVTGPTFVAEAKDTAAGVLATTRLSTIGKVNLSGVPINLHLVSLDHTARVVSGNATAEKSFSLGDLSLPTLSQLLAALGLDLTGTLDELTQGKLTQLAGLVTTTTSGVIKTANDT